MYFFIKDWLSRAVLLLQLQLTPRRKVKEKLCKKSYVRLLVLSYLPSIFQPHRFSRALVINCVCNTTFFYMYI